MPFSYKFVSVTEYIRTFFNDSDKVYDTTSANKVSIMEIKYITIKSK